MSARITTQKALRRRRLNTFLWIAVLAAITISLIYYEKISWLYVLATLGVTGILGVVAFADLAHGEPVPASNPSETPVSSSNPAKRF